MPHTGCDVYFWACFNRMDKMSQKSGFKMRYGQYVTNAGWMNSSPIFLWMIWAVLGWMNSPSTFMFAWVAVLQWRLWTWVAKYSGLYMWVEVSLEQGVHGLFIKVSITMTNIVKEGTYLSCGDQNRCGHKCSTFLEHASRIFTFAWICSKQVRFRGFQSAFLIRFTLTICFQLKYDLNTSLTTRDPTHGRPHYRYPLYTSPIGLIYLNCLPWGE